MSSKLHVGLMCLLALALTAGSAFAYDITINVTTDPPGLTAPAVVMDGDDYTLEEGEANSLWVRSTTAHPDDPVYQAYESTSDQYNLDSPGPDYADGGDPLNTPRVTLTGGSLHKGNGTWPVDGAPQHCDWYQIHTPVDNMVVSVVYKAVEIPITYAGDAAAISGPAVTYHSTTGAVAQLTLNEGWTVTDLQTSNGTLTITSDTTAEITGVTEFAGITVTVTAEADTTVVVPDLTLMTQAEAETALADAGLTLGSVTLVYNETVEAGLVISQSVAAGSEVAGATAVDIVISRGSYELPAGMPVGGMVALGALIATLGLGGAVISRRRK